MTLVEGRALGLHRDRRPAPQRARRVYGARPGATIPDAGAIREDATLPILHQGVLSTCAGNTVAEALILRSRAQRVRAAQSAQIQSPNLSLAGEGFPTPTELLDELPSRNWLCYQGRVRTRHQDRDVGMTFGDVFEAAAMMGFPPERAWPYDGLKSGDPEGDGAPTDAFRRMPDDAQRLAYDQRLKGGLDVAYHALDESGVQVVDDVRHAIALDDYPVCVGVDVDAKFCRGEFDPKAPLDPPKEPKGGHAMLIVAYSKSADGRFVFKVRNSWGPKFGDDGYVYFSEEYVRSGELWLVEQVPVLPLGDVS